MEVPVDLTSVTLYATVLFQLFLIIDPVAAIPIFLAITKDNTHKERKAMVFRATVVAFLVLAFFAIIGRQMLTYFNISMSAVQIAGGILLFTIGIEMLFGRVTRTETSEHEEKVAAEKEDVSITPLAIPLLAGPGAITATMLYSHQNMAGPFVVIVALFLITMISCIILNLSEKLHQYVGPIGLKVIGRVMGLLLTFVAVQLFLNGLKATGILPT